ncbi:MAG: hypothetical protein KKH06_02880, partial [Gammaproteobacteria bacterium]|nr:hypothetical protein [Gammaproteobacteria bacterium]
MKKLFLPFVFLSLTSVSVWANVPQQNAVNTKGVKQATPVKKASPVDDDEYYLEPVSQKKTTPANASTQDDDEYYLDATQPKTPAANKRKLPPSLLEDQQSHQLDKLSQSRDNPKPKHYWKDKLGAAALLDVDLTDATHPGFTHSRDDDISVPNIKINLDGKLDPWLSGHIGLFWS